MISCLKNSEIGDWWIIRRWLGSTPEISSHSSNLDIGNFATTFSYLWLCWSEENEAENEGIKSRIIASYA